MFTFFDTNINVPSWNGSQLAFRNFVVDNGTNRNGVWAGTAGSLNLIAAEGFNAPGTSLPIETIFGNPVLSASGHIAFRAKLDDSDPGVTTSTDDIICYGPLDKVQVILRAGDQAPGFTLGETVTFFSLSNEFEMAPDGRLAFTMSQTANTTPTIWIAKPGGSIDLVAAKDIVFDNGGVTYTMDSSTINFLNSGNTSFIIDNTGFNGSDGRPSPFGPAGEFVFTAELKFPASPLGEQVLVRYTAAPTVLIVPTLTIQANTPTANDIRLLIQTVTGQSYTLNRSKDINLSDPWSPVQSSIPGTGGIIMVDELNALATHNQAYYQAVTTSP